MVEQAVELDDVGMQLLPREAIVTQLAVFLDERTRPSLSLIQLKALQVDALPTTPPKGELTAGRQRADQSLFFPRNIQSMRAFFQVN